MKSPIVGDFPTNEGDIAQVKKSKVDITVKEYIGKSQYFERHCLSSSGF